ncbi:hypothetical protein RV15_GL000151 [Enterococcus silesiacus]|uniref:Uncharacterized protein n=1 Tax=Enterococcus silesiacus TaxID=332949 RepID=A0AA91GNN7_9ENTE|nr:hypothetical protein RV15_GL000151 [Enterococcus silesiacus]
MVFVFIFIYYQNMTDFLKNKEKNLGLMVEIYLKLKEH